MLLNTINFSFVLVKPDVQFTVNDSSVCLGDVVSFTCSAVGKPVVHTLQLFRDDSLLSNSSSSIVWSRATSIGGDFIYTCVANNTVGTTNVTAAVAVNGKQETTSFVYYYILPFQLQSNPS